MYQKWKIRIRQQLKSHESPFCRYAFLVLCSTSSPPTQPCNVIFRFSYILSSFCLLKRSISFSREDVLQRAVAVLTKTISNGALLNTNRRKPSCNLFLLKHAVVVVGSFEFVGMIYRFYHLGFSLLRESAPGVSFFLEHHFCLTAISFLYVVLFCVNLCDFLT